MLCLPYAFWSVCLLRYYFGSKTWNHPNCPFRVCFLSFWTWALGSDPAFDCDFSLSYSEVPSAPAQCFSIWRNLGPIYKWFVQNSVLLHKQFLCSCGTSAQVLQKSPPSPRSQACRPAWPYLTDLPKEDVLLDLSPARPPVNVHYKVIGTVSRFSGHWGPLLAVDPTLVQMNKSFCIVTHWRLRLTYFKESCNSVDIAFSFSQE